MPIFRSSKRKIAITLGDPGGVGYEVTLKALESVWSKKSNVVFVLFGAYEFVLKTQSLLKTKLTFNRVDSFGDIDFNSEDIYVVDVCPDKVKEVEIGKVSQANAEISFESLRIATEYALNNQVDALVTASINKEAVQLLLPDFTGHTEYLAQVSRIDKFAMMLVGGPLRVVLVTTHLPLNNVSSKITKSSIVEKIVLVDDFLRTKLNKENGKIGVAALNPHAGEGGKMGFDERDVINPAVEEAKQKGFNVVGALPADIIFHEAYEGRLDAIVSMYHDQGLGPLKMIAFHTGVNVTLGLPFIRTSPDHGTAFDIAYKGVANAGSMIEAIKMAVELAVDEN